MDKDKLKKQFPCPYCSEKPFTTKQNLQRHCLRKHSNISETVEDDNISVLSTDTTIISINYQSDNDVPEIQKPEPIPPREELIDIMNKYEKYQHLFPAIKRQIKWDEYNSKVDINYHRSKWDKNMVYLMVDIRDAKLPI
jgi:hypothetical protein